MNVGVPLLDDRVAPRCTSANRLLMVSLEQRRVESHRVVAVSIETPEALVDAVRSHALNVLVCGGVTREARQLLEAVGTAVVDNVAGSAAELLEALAHGTLHSGFGLDRTHDAAAPAVEPPDPAREVSQAELAALGFDCLACDSRSCLGDAGCPYLPHPLVADPPSASLDLLVAVMRVNSRAALHRCRLAEVIDLCRELDCARVGIAFCIDLLEPTRTVIRVVRRFFHAVPVCCAVKPPGHLRQGPASATGLAAPECRAHCGAVLQARILAAARTDINLLVGLSAGSDALFCLSSHSPVTTVIARDVALAHNPIAAIYSERHLRQCLPGRRSLRRTVPDSTRLRPPRR